MAKTSTACSTTATLPDCGAAGSRNNIRNDAIKFLARYVRERLRRPEKLQPLEIQFLALGTYVETMRQLDTAMAARRGMLSDQEFANLCDYIEQNLEGKLTCAGLSVAVNLPLRAVYDGVKRRTGRSPYNLIIEKRIERARGMLQRSNASIAGDRLRLRFLVATAFDGDDVAPVGPHAPPPACRILKPGGKSAVQPEVARVARFRYLRVRGMRPAGVRRNL